MPVWRIHPMGERGNEAPRSAGWQQDSVNDMNHAVAGHDVGAGHGRIIDRNTTAGGLDVERRPSQRLRPDFTLDIP